MEAKICHGTLSSNIATKFKLAIYYLARGRTLSWVEATGGAVDPEE